MAGKSKIEWTDATWNPVVGCSVLTPGCTNCYAMKMASRIEAMKRSHYDGTTRKVNGNAVWTGKLVLAPEHILLEPLRRKKPTTYFVNSMGDLFHEDAPDEWIDKVFAVMALAPQHTFQVLTKRADRMLEYMTRPLRGPWEGRATRDGQPCTDVDWRMRSRVLDLMRVAPGDALNRACKFMDERDGGEGDGFYRLWPLPNVWLGVSAERQQEADQRIPLLLQTPAAVRFLSAEPLLGPIDLTKVRHQLEGESFKVASVLEGDDGFGLNAPRNRLDWVIVGGESGPGARPMHPDWARSIRDQCRFHGVPFLFKQWGEHKPLFDAMRGTFIGSVRVGKKSAGRTLDLNRHSAMPRPVPHE